MSTVTQARPATQDGAPTRLLGLPLALTFLAEFTSLTSFFLLLSALPMLAAIIVATATARLIERRSIYEARLTDEEVAARLKAREPSGA